MCVQANAGDSRAVACVAGKVQELSYDHKPHNQSTHSIGLCPLLLKYIYMYNVHVVMHGRSRV